MTATSQSSKLTELRAKTDRDLVAIIDNALEVGLLLAATETQGDSAERLRGRAQEIYANTLMLLLKVEDVSERRRLADKLKHLRDTLERRAAAGCWSASPVLHLNGSRLLPAAVMVPRSCGRAVLTKVMTIE